MISDDRLLYDALIITLTILSLAWLVVWLTRLLARRRPDLRIGHALFAASVVRLLSAALFAAVPPLRPTRGPDEGLWLQYADRLIEDTGALGDMPGALLGNLHVAYMAFAQLVLDPTSDYPLRVGMIALSVCAIATVSVAVADLAGCRAGIATAWILAFEPNNIFFSGLLHKEAPMLLAEGLVILGCVWMYQRRDPLAAGVLALGLVVAGLTRPYAGGALAVAGMAACAHAALRPLGADRRRAPRLFVAVLVVAAVLVSVAPSPGSILNRLQESQNANATDTSNLRLAPIDLTSVGSAAEDTASRVAALLLQPYPWQVANTSQRFGVVGTLIAWTMLLVTTVLAFARFRYARTRLPPMLYVVVLLTLAYALSTGNAGTGFRYRTHLLVGITATMASLAYATRSNPLRYRSAE